MAYWKDAPKEVQDAHKKLLEARRALVKALGYMSKVELTGDMREHLREYLDEINVVLDKLAWYLK